MEIEDIKEIIESTVVALASVNGDSKPHNIAVENVCLKESKIIIADEHMNTTIENIKHNPKVSLVFGVGENGWIVDGEAEYHESGKWIDFVKLLKENEDKELKGAVVINVNEVGRLS